jgi:hypothetical protein
MNGCVTVFPDGEIATAPRGADGPFCRTAIDPDPTVMLPVRFAVVDPTRYEITAAPPLDEAAERMVIQLGAVGVHEHQELVDTFTEPLPPLDWNAALAGASE